MNTNRGVDLAMLTRMLQYAGNIVLVHRHGEHPSDPCRGGGSENDLDIHVAVRAGQVIEMTVAVYQHGIARPHGAAALHRVRGTF